MLIDFTPIRNGEKKYSELAADYNVEKLRAATNASIDRILALIADLDDADVTFDPIDPEANDPYAVEGEEKIGWSLAHLIVHVTASSEEWATYGSILARGIDYPAEPRLRYETLWNTVKTKAECVQRLEESRRMRLGYLAAFPDMPNLTTRRGLSERFTERFGEINAYAAVMFGMSHEDGHYAQMEEVKRQALAAKQMV
jgi:hypothetical protein